jgi:hypothetical protein
MLSGYKEVFGSTESSPEERVEFRDASLPEYEVGSRGNEQNRVFGIGSCRIIARN